jgi:cytochrome c oxidase subunit 4
MAATKTHEPARGGPHIDKETQASHTSPVWIYFAIFGVLLTLTGVTVSAAYMDLAGWAAPVAVGIASVKATLVVLYFMHVRYGSRLIALYAASGFLFLAILLGITLSEVAGRRAQLQADPLRPTAPRAADGPHGRPDDEPP